MGDSKKTKNTTLDPLYTIFEHHLLHFGDAGVDRKTFLAHVVADYFKHLRKNKILIPKGMEEAVSVELGRMVNQMLIKKIYGFHDITEFQENTPKSLKRAAKSRYRKVQSK